MPCPRHTHANTVKQLFWPLLSPFTQKKHVKKNMDDTVPLQDDKRVAELQEVADLTEECVDGSFMTDVIVDGRSLEGNNTSPHDGNEVKDEALR
jgi:hypothetical protein